MEPGISIEPIGENFRSAPAPVLLSVRYSNGIVLNQRARALIYDESKLLVLSQEDIEVKTLVTVMTPFLENIVPCRVSSSSRNPEWQGYFELELVFLQRPRPTSRSKKAKAAFRPEKVPTAFPEEIALCAQQLAARLQQGSALPFGCVLREVPPEMRPLFATVGAIVVAKLLHDKMTVDLGRVIQRVAEMPAKKSRSKGGQR